MREGLVEFVEFPSFTRRLEQYGDPELLKAIQDELHKNPEAGDLLKGGIRKARVHSPAREEGKRGGYRVWYYFLRIQETIFLLYLLDKREAANISKQQLDQLAQAMKEALKGLR